MSWFRSRSKNSPKNSTESSPPINYGQSPSFHAPFPVNYGSYFPPPPGSPYGGVAVAQQPSSPASYIAPTAVRSPHDGLLSPQAVPDSRALALRGEASLYRPPPPPPLPPRQVGPSPPSPYLSPQSPSQWNNSSIGRPPSPYLSPQSLNQWNNSSIGRPPSRNISPQTPSQWNTSSIGRTPSPYQMPQPQSEAMKKEPPKLRKILSLGIHTLVHLQSVVPLLTCTCSDGGGVRGLSIIMILKSIMRNLNRKRKTNLEPWQEFDMIGGTSTGG